MHAYTADISQRLSTLTSDCPEEIRHQVLDVLRSQISCDGGVFFTCTTVEGQHYYTDMTAQGDDAVQEGFERYNSTSAFDAAWLPSKLDPTTVDTFVRLRNLYGEEYETTEVVEQIYLPIEIGDNIRAIFVDGDELLGWVGLVRRGMSERFRPSERKALQRLGAAVKSALAAADAATEADFAGAICATFTSDGALEHCTDLCARWLDADKRHILRRWVRDFDSGTDLRPIRLLAGGEVRLVRMDGAPGVRYLVTVDRAQKMQLDPYQWLTKRQRQIAEFAIQGATSYEIADHLEISRGTVRTHLKNIYRRLDVGCRAELVQKLSPPGK